MLAFADAGCDIAALDVTRPVPGAYPLATAEMLEATVRAVEERGRRCVALPWDLRDESQVEAAVAKALSFFDDRIDIVVNNAAVAALGAIQGVRRSDVDLVLVSEFGINVNAVAPTTIPPGAGQGSGRLSGLAPAGLAAELGTSPPLYSSWTRTTLSR